MAKDDPPVELDAEFVQLLTPEGERVHHVGYDVDFTDDEYRGLYHDLVVIRRLDAEGTALQRQGELALWVPLLGQEAAQVGSGHALRRTPTYELLTGRRCSAYVGVRADGRAAGRAGGRAAGYSLSLAARLSGIGW